MGRSPERRCEVIRMIVTDLDDTLLRTDKTISPYTAGVFGRVRRLGVKTAYATARGGSAAALVGGLVFDARIHMNGATAHVDGRCVYERRIPPEVARPILEALTRMRVKAAAEIRGTHHANFDVQARWPYIHDCVSGSFESLPGDADKLYAVIERPAQAAALEALLPDTLYMRVSKDSLAMIMHREATKLCAVTAVAEVLGIGLDDVAAFGDDVNDLELLGGCGTAVAVDNALEAVKAAAGTICPSNDGDGVARWVAEKILSKNI